MRRWILKLLGVNKQYRDLYLKIRELQELVERRGLFMDHSGRAVGDYNSTEVSEAWDRFNKLSNDIRKTCSDNQGHWWP